jgi:hypothetical protein
MTSTPDQRPKLLAAMNKRDRSIARIICKRVKRHGEVPRLLIRLAVSHTIQILSERPFAQVERMLAKQRFLQPEETLAAELARALRLAKNRLKVRSRKLEYFTKQEHLAALRLLSMAEYDDDADAIQMLSKALRILRPQK